MDITVCLTLEDAINVRFRAKIAIDGMHDEFIDIQANTAVGIFGADPSELEQTEDNSSYLVFFSLITDITYFIKAAP